MPVTLDRPYCDLLDVQEITGNSESEAADTLRRAINAASRLVEDETGRGFWFYDHAETAYAVPRKCVVGEFVSLPFPVITLTAATLDGVAVDVGALYLSDQQDSTTTLVNSTDWGAIPFTGAITLTGTFGHALIEASEEEGSPDPAQTAPPTIPASVRRATALIAAALSNEWRRERVALDGSRESMLETRIPAEALTLLRRYSIKRRYAGI